MVKQKFKSIFSSNKEGAEFMSILFFNTFISPLNSSYIHRIYPSLILLIKKITTEFSWHKINVLETYGSYHKDHNFG